MIRTRTRGAAALLVVGALAVTSGAPSIVASPAPGLTYADPAVTPGVRLDSTAVVAVIPSPGTVAGPLATPNETPGAPAAPDPTNPPVLPPRCDPPPPDLAAARVASHGSRARKVVALTFDDGYNPTNTLHILSILRAAHVNATFFVTGRAVLLFPTVWREVTTAGYPIADHTYDHHHLGGLCFASQVRELTKQADAVRDVLGHDPVGLMRPPYGSKDGNTALAARAAGDAAVVLWDVDTRDWSGIGPWQIAKRALAGGRGSIVLMHTLYSTTAAALPRIIRDYRARGFQFVTVGELLGVPGPVPFG